MIIPEIIFLAEFDNVRTKIIKLKLAETRNNSRTDSEIVSNFSIKTMGCFPHEMNPAASQTAPGTSSQVAPAPRSARSTPNQLTLIALVLDRRIFLRLTVRADAVTEF